MRALWTLLFGICLVAGCQAEEPVDVVVETQLQSVLVGGDMLSRVDVVDATGRVIETRRSSLPSDRIKVSVGWHDGARSVRVYGASGVTEIPLTPPVGDGDFELRVDAPMGQGPVLSTDGDVRQFSLMAGASAQVGMTVTVLTAGRYTLEFGDEVTVHPAVRAGERLMAMSTISADTRAVVRGPGPDDLTQVYLRVVPVTAATLSAQLSLVSAPFPVDQAGNSEISRPADRVTLPADWWKFLLKRTSLGTRNWGRYEPWGNQGVRLRNAGDQAINVAIRSVVTSVEGEPDPVFRPRFRDIDSSTGETSVLLRVPAQSTATAILPLYVDDALLPEVMPAEGWLRHIEVTPLGMDTPTIVDDKPLFVSKASSWSSLALVLALLGAILGAAVLARNWRGWLNERPTTSLMTIAMLGAMMFTVGAGGQLLGMGVAAMLGPFSSLFTGLVDDAFRTALMMTLLMLVPRPGSATLAALVEAMLGALALGNIGPSQLLMLGNRILWTEGFLWCAGVTRSDAWTREAPWLIWLRVSLGLGLANLMNGALGLVLASVLYRFYYADWYVVMILAGPSFGYVLIGCAIGLPFARSLRAVSS
jgi:hypothetical protein